MFSQYDDDVIMEGIFCGPVTVTNGEYAVGILMIN